ncbi:MAG TPA: TRIC cation channel family protein, partial [Acidimicrobiia bacterium]|nr:TRIC cation channel family protein [Acidimicrobiia bacterium]
PDLAPVLQAFDPTLLLVLNLAGTFVFGLSGGLAGVRVRLDVFGVVVLAAVVGLAGGITRDLLIGLPAQAFRDWGYLTIAILAGVMTLLAPAALTRLERPILVFDAAGLALFCVTGASTALDHGVAPIGAVVLGAITGIGGGVLRDILVREIPVVLRTGLYAIPALVGAAIVVIASARGSHNLAFPIVGAAVCFAIRAAGVYFDWKVPRPPAAHDESR